MRALFALFLGFALMGCCMAPPEAGGGGTPQGAGNESNAIAPSTNQTGSQVQQGAQGGGQEPPPVTGEGTIIEAGGNAAGAEKPAQGQQDCATLTSDCGACVAKPNCGWCKSSNGCYYGDSGGPHSGQCQDADWATTSAGCEAPSSPEGSACGQQTNCAFCLSGSGCKWCIQGGKCADASSTESCFGGWLNKSYQCNYASR